MGSKWVKLSRALFFLFIYLLNPIATTTNQRSQVLIQSDSISNLQWTPAALFDQCQSLANPQALHD